MADQWGSLWPVMPTRQTAFDFEEQNWCVWRCCSAPSAGCTGSCSGTAWPGGP